MIRTITAATIDSSGSCSQVGRTVLTSTINVCDLHKTLGSLVAVDDPDLTIRSGEVAALLSPSDVGRSTTLDMVFGLTLSDAGMIKLLRTSPNHTIQAGCVGVTFQDGGLLDDFAVGKTLWVVASMGPRHCDSILHASRFSDVIDQASLRKLLTRKVGRCSGGEHQHLHLALALLPSPNPLVMNESTAGIDVSARAAFWETTRTQTRHGRATLFATHYLEEAISFADRIIIIAHGRLVADGNVDEVRALGEGTLITATWPGLSEESLGWRLADCPAADSIGRTAVHGERMELYTTDSDTVARWLLNVTPAEYPGIGAASLNEVLTTLTSDDSDETAP